MLIVKRRVKQADHAFLEAFDSGTIFNNSAPVFQRPQREISVVREILRNPKYTGYMVYNRRASTSAGGRVNPPSAWVWSDQPTHEKLITKETYEAAQAMAFTRERSRATAAPNRHPQTRRTYTLRSYVYCTLCGRRMFGKTEYRRKTDYTYFSCQPDRNHKGREDRFVDHPSVVRVREDALLDAVHDFFATRIFGPQRRALIETDLPQADQRAEDDWNARCAALRTRLEEIDRRQDRLIARFDDPDESGSGLDAEAERELARRLRARFAELEAERRAKTADLAALEVNRPRHDHRVGLLDGLPRLQQRLADLPEQRQRELYDVFHLEVHYDIHEHTALVRVTMSEDTIDGVARTAENLVSSGRGMPGNNNRRQPPGRAKPANAPFADVVGAPGRIRTCGTRFRKPLLYPLSYEGLTCNEA